MTMSGSTIPDKLPEHTINNFRKSVLDWYDQNRRTLPWRALPGVTPDPYHVWLSEIMLQQTVVAAVIPYFLKFTSLWPTVHDLATAPLDDVLKEWAGLGYYARARNLHKCAIAVSTNLSDSFPQTYPQLKELPGIGDYTAAAILSIGFNKPSVVVDGNVERVMSRYFAITQPLPDSKPAIRKAAGLLSTDRQDRPSDYAQALMDLGATICIPKAPRCGACPLHKNCQARLQGIAADLPTRARKKPKPFRRGYVYWVSDSKSGDILLEKRPEKGLFGGMIGFPTSEWLESGEIEHPEAVLKLGMPVLLKDHLIRHSFTHFDLELQGYRVTAAKLPKSAHLVAKKDLQKSGLPSLFQKFARFISHNQDD